MRAGREFVVSIAVNKNKTAHIKRPTSDFVSCIDTQDILNVHKFKSDIRYYYNFTLKSVIKLCYLLTNITIVVTTAARNTKAPNTPNAIIAPVYINNN